MAAAKSKGEGGSILDRVREELGRVVSSQLDRLASKAGDKLTDLTDRLTDAAEDGGSLPKIGSRILKGDSPVKAAVGEKAKDVKDSVMGGSDGGGGSGEGGDLKATHITEVLDVGVPLRSAYDHWTAYDKFSAFTKGVQDVSKDDDEVTSDWSVKVGPSKRNWTATVLEQVPDDRIVWKTEGGQGNTHGAVSFHEIAPNLTRIVLVVEYQPAGFLEKTGNLWRAQGRRIRLDFKHFRRYVTFAEEEAEGWRGEIRDGEVVRTHEEAMDEEEADGEEEEYEDEETDEDDEAEYDEDEEED